MGMKNDRIEVKAEMRKIKGMYVMRFRYYLPDENDRKERCFSTHLRASKENEMKAMQIMWDKRKEFEEEVNVEQIARKKEKTEFTLFIQRWIRALEKTNQLEPNTIGGYKSKIRTYIIPYFEDKGINVQDITTMDIEGFYNYLYTEKKLSASTINKVHICINNAFKDACRQDFLTKNPAQYARRPKVQKYIAQTLTIKEWNQLREIFKNDVIEVPVMLSAYLGLRRSEVLALRWCDIDFESNIITIRRKSISVKGNGKMIREMVKTKSSYRKICMPEKLAEFLKEWKSRQEENKRIYAECYINESFSDYVCTWPDGKLIRPDYVTDRFHSVIHQSKLKNVRFHDLRHTIATLLNEHGASLQDIKELLGHSTISTTSNTYIGFSQDIAHKNAELTQNLVTDG